nr:hypothetical protein CFP56_34423 [Quercus suber]
MSSEASSEQSCVREGAGYDDVYPSGEGNLGASSLKRVLFANSPSEEEDEDSDVDGLESGASGDSDGEENVESPISSIVGPTALGSSFSHLFRRSMILTLPLKKVTSIHCVKVRLRDADDEGANGPLHGPETSSLRKQVREAKEDGKTEFRNSNRFLVDLDASWVSLDDMAQTLARSVESEGTNKLFEADPTPDAQGDGGTIPRDG